MKSIDFEFIGFRMHFQFPYQRTASEFVFSSCRSKVSVDDFKIGTTVRVRCFISTSLVLNQTLVGAEIS